MENLVLKINQKEVKVRENQTTLKGVRLVVSYTIEKLGMYANFTEWFSN